MNARLAGLKLAGVSAAALVAGLLAFGQAGPNSSDPLLQAMRDEAARSKNLNISGVEAPYFIQYTIDDADAFTVSANLGGVVRRQRARARVPDIDVRVGDYKFDNTNFGGFGGPRMADGFPVEDSYAVVRRYFWLQTDIAYKAAVEALSRKRSALRGVTQNEDIPDFARAEPVRRIGQFTPLTIDENTWTDRIRSLSALFRQYPDIVYSTVDLEANNGGYYLVNTEGTEVKEPENVVLVRARAVAQAADGMNIRDGVAFQASDANQLPSEIEMGKAIAEMARNISALTRAPRGEEYTGPVLFEGQAGPQIMAEVLARNLAPARRPVGGGGRGGATAASELEGRMGARVLPDSFDVVDDPTLPQWHGRALFGSYGVDREGVLPKPLRLIEKGVLKGFLLTRQPVRGFEGSNGRSRLPGGAGVSGAAPSNLFVTSSNAQPLAEMKKNLIDLIKQRAKPYGIIVRKMDFPSSAGAVGQGVRSLSVPILVYKIYPDGREELVRGLRFRNFNVRSLKDILAAGDDSQAFEYMNSQGGYSAETCVIAPSFLIDDLELYVPEEELPRLPVVPPPAMSFGFAPGALAAPNR
jgi:predicted Zn-dependent protease